MFVIGLALFARKLIGGGDVKLIAAVSLWAGLEHFVWFVLVTSLASPEDRRRGQEAGANAYIVKGEFEQGRFLDTVRRLLQGGA